MKNVYLSILLLLSSLFTIAQEEVELFGEWFLNYRTFGPTTIYPPLTTSEDYNVILNFSLLPPTASNPFVIESYGPETTTYEGRFEVENGIMYIFNVEENLQNCGHPELVCSYFDEYNNGILFDPGALAEPGEYAVSYELTGTGDDAILTITNDFNNPEGVIGAHAVYGRQPATYNDITGNWFVQSITIDGVQHDNYVGEYAINFTENPWYNDGSFGFSGGSPCNGFGGGYTLFDNNTLAFLEWGQLASCSGSDAFGRYYFKMTDVLDVGIDPSEPIPMDYSIIGSGLEQSLTITNSDGDFVVFGKEAPTETIFKTWYSYSTETTDGIFYPSPEDIATFEMSPFSTNPYGGDVNGNGGCNDFHTAHNIYSSTLNGNEFWLFLFDQTLIECDNNTYEPIYFSVLSDEPNAIFNYELQDEGETLILTNSIGDILTFGSLEPPTTNLLGEWKLHYIVVDDIQMNNPDNATPTLTLDSLPNTIGFHGEGNAVCNYYSIDYHLNPQQTLAINSFAITLTDCESTEDDNYEYSYVNRVLVNDIAPSELRYELNGTDNDATLVLTNLDNGNQAYYGRQTLTIEDQIQQSFSITLDKNPVDDLLSFSSNNLQEANYKIYSITGTLVSNGKLNSDTIDVNRLQSGLYFLKVSDKENNTKILKFIKQ